MNTSVSQSSIPAPAKSYHGAAKAAWVVIFIACAAAVVPVLGWIAAGPLLFASMVLSIVVLVRGGTAQGVTLLLMTMVGAPLLIVLLGVLGVGSLLSL
ncbi:MAG: hypothetical protein ACT4PZ_24645 [Panacagrimonas sp.]